MRISLGIPSRRMSYLRRAYAIHSVSILIAIEARDIRIDIVLAMSCMNCWIIRCWNVPSQAVLLILAFLILRVKYPFWIAMVVLQVVVQI